jgi:hypothetical protein
VVFETVEGIQIAVLEEDHLRRTQEPNHDQQADAQMCCFVPVTGKQ